MSEQAYANPVKRYWRFGPHELGFISPLRWEWSAYGLGSVRKTPWGAWWAWRRWHREWRSRPWDYAVED
jgi:hypothetical protein